IAVSQFMKKDVHELYGVPLEKIRIIHNGIDLNDYKPTFHPQILASYQINLKKPFILFVGRITRQKGIVHLVNAIKYFCPGIQIVLCAGAPDTEEIGKEMTEKVKQAQTETENEIIWISQIVPKDHIVNLYTHAAIFVCPSIYEPFGIINLEAMACETPVVASAVGGIQEVVVHNETGLLVPFEPQNSHNLEPRDPEQFSRDLASAINNLISSPGRMHTMGIKSRERVEKYFSWNNIAKQTLEFYRDLT
ncbi:MAG: glycosyltransferase, partial [Candidatus Tectomicrobia bacterium]|nr:glycosyltransferase [Candidatus Tectomicrobia bacterium]